MVGDEVDAPIEFIGCRREIVDFGVPMDRIAAIPTVGCVRVPIVGTDDGELVDAPTVGVVDVPIVETAVPIVADDVAPSVCESVVRVDPVVPSEVIAGSVEAEGPMPNFAAKELKSVAPLKPRVASKASKSGSDAAGMMGAVSVGNMNSLVLGTEEGVVATPPAVPDVSVETCACATHGIAMTATGAIHRMILVIPPPC
jgi:hypothetical protein